MGIQFPYVDTFYCHNPVLITIDSWDTGNMIRLSTVQKLKVDICKSTQSAHQADGSSPLKVIGETKLSFTRGKHVFQFEGLVVENLDVEVHAGTLFMEANDIAVRPAKRLATLADAPLSLTSLPMIVLHSKLRFALWFSMLPQPQPFYDPRLYRTRTPTRSHFRLAPCLGAPLRHNSGLPSNHFRALAPSWHYF